MKTRILRVHGGSGGHAQGRSNGQAPEHLNGGEDRSLERWDVPASTSAADMASLQEAAERLRVSDVPVAFPTETVYGLGADATRSAAVRGIYAAKGRPADNPLIVHVCDLEMLRGLLDAADATRGGGRMNGTTNGAVTNGAIANGANEHDEKPEAHVDREPIPAIYHPLIRRFWPGPLTILLPSPQPSRLAPELTAGLSTFGARMPASALARSLIRLAGTPLAAPSANASTRPSPTTARHVLDDLDGRIEVVLDGGPCRVGVESTVVDGLSSPPAVLRPGGVSIAELRTCPGWEGVVRAYRDGAENGAKPRAPGMKYKHYSPRARVVLYEAGRKGALGPGDDVGNLVGAGENGDAARVRTVGFIRTGGWPAAGGFRCRMLERSSLGAEQDDGDDAITSLEIQEGEPEPTLVGTDSNGTTTPVRVLDIDLGSEMGGIAQGLFSALRELDRRGADTIFVEGVGDRDDIAAAVMNRLRKAASEIRS